MKRLPCKHEKCGERRVHHDRPDTPRGVRFVDVPDDFTEDDPVFCSITCAVLDGWMSLKYETYEEMQARKEAWRAKRLGTV